MSCFLFFKTIKTVNSSEVIFIFLHICNLCGQVMFFDANGKVLLQEKQDGGKIISPAVAQYEHTQHVQRFFESHPDEAIYGLGAHQNGMADKIIKYDGTQIKVKM